MKTPSGLSTEGKELWNTITANWKLDDGQLVVLFQACQSLDRMNDAKRILKTEGLTSEDRFGQSRAHPAVAIERDTRQLFLRAIKQLNLSKAEGVTSNESAFDRFLAGKKN